MDIIEKHKTLKNQLEGTGWEDIIIPFIDSIGFKHIMDKLIEYVSQGRRFTPKLIEWLKPFIHCHYSNMKVIFINSDPYPWINVPDGLAFSCSKTNEEEKTLSYMFDYIESTNKDYLRDPDLTRWAEQGVLLYNSSITTELSKLGTHQMVWHMFTTHLLKAINHDKSNLIVVLFGKNTTEWRNLLNKQTILEVEHPNAAIHKGKWNGEDMFNEVNKYLKDQGKSQIIW